MAIILLEFGTIELFLIIFNFLTALVFLFLGWLMKVIFAMLKDLKDDSSNTYKELSDHRVYIAEHYVTNEKLKEAINGI